jgi:hypothetical protein
MGLIVAVMFLADHPRVFRRHQRQIVVLDTAATNEVALVAHLEQVLGARVHSASVQRVDLVNDTTVVDVRYSRSANAAADVLATAHVGAHR